MKKLLLCFVFLIFSSFSYSQNTKLPKKTKKGDLQEIILYYDNGNVMQHGFYTKDGKLHASWKSYNMDGTKKCNATYNYGVKEGIWTYWSKNKTIKITYKNNKVINIEEITDLEKPKINE
ncbi:toxin-antitoxin system YwqK family antitoxin [Lutibacter citreus]|uniref:nicotinic acid mononucleotide adenyltransferase n=1 Tax=Lutibacter citreus TaxID=2138210 RepID=UPI000DBE6C87|nr:nicotinic acid mononucleotide adenyltransferase [Lutibacter citreus]